MVNNIFNSLLTLTQESAVNAQEYANKGLLYISPSLMNEAGEILFNKIKKGEFATFIVPGRASWNAKANYFEAAREAMRRNKNLKINRLFIIPNRQSF
jgi:hypothetical protein